MAKTLDKSKKRKRVESKSKKPKIQPECWSSSDSESENEFDPEELRELLQPYSKEQLMDLICSSSQIGSSIYSAVVEAADRDVTHRKIFVYGLPWETTREALLPFFQEYGEIEECTVVMDKVTGKAKGFGFVLFKNRRGAREALKEPKKRILNRTATCQLASMGPGASGKGQDQPGPVKIQQFTGGMAASPFMQYHPLYGAPGGAYMYPMLGLTQSTQIAGIGQPPVAAGLSVLDSYFRGHTAFPDSDTTKRGTSKDSDAHGYSNYSW